MKMRTIEFSKLDHKIIYFLNQISMPVLRYSLSLTFIWFGALKLIGNSPAADLVTKTVYWIDPDIFIPILGYWEVAIGLCILYRPLIRIGLFLLALQMPGTFLPLILLPEVCFSSLPFGLTLEGQYIVKNLVLIGAALIVGSKLIPIKLKLSE